MLPTKRITFVLASLLSSTFLPLTQAEVPLETTFQMKAEIKDMRMAMERLHFTQKVVTEEELGSIISNYMERLDFNHLYFLKSDELLWEQRFGRTLKNNYLDKNELYPAFYIFNVFEDRVNERLQWTREFLESDLNLFEQDEYVTKDDDETWSPTKKDSDIRWRQQIKNEILSEIIPELREELEDHFGEDQVPELTQVILDEVIPIERQDELIAEAKTTIIERYERWEKRISEMKAAEVQEDFLTELAQLYDPHSNFMSPDTSEDFGISISNELIGIGAVLQDDKGYCKILELIDGGPAALSGEIDEEDVIIAVAQGKNGEFEDVVGRRLRDIVRLIRGKENSLVRLKVQSKKDSEDKVVHIIRQRIKLEEKLASAELFEIPAGDRTIPVGVITLPNFYGPTNGNPHSTRASDDVDRLISKLKMKGVEGIVLDLRTNGGGLLDEAINVTGLFISKGPVVKVKSRAGDVDVSEDLDPRISWNGPLAVLTSRYSASASEIVAGALQYYKRAIIIGDESTHGKGTVQTTFALPISVYEMYGRDNRFMRSNFLEKVGRLIPMQQSRSGIPSMAKITIAKYYLPDGSSTQLRGVESDIALPSIAEILPIRESDLDNPLVWDVIEGHPIETDELVSNAYPYLQPNLIDQLNTRSLERRSSLEEFNYLTDSISTFRERYERETLPLSVIDRINLINSDNRIRDDLEAYNERLYEIGAFVSTEIPLAEPSEESQILSENKSDSKMSKVDLNAPSESTVAEAETQTDEESSSNTGTALASNQDEALEADSEETEEDEEETPTLDIHLRETLRIVGDWIELEKYLSEGPESRQIAIHSMATDTEDKGFHWSDLGSKKPATPATN